MATALPRRYAEVGARIRRARERSGISQERFAPMIGITRRHLIRLENGEHHPSPDLRARIAEHTGEKPESFSVDEDEESDPVTDLLNALERYVRREIREAGR